MNRLSFLSTATFLLFGVGILILGVWLRVAYTPEALRAESSHGSSGAHPWAVEADCYSQLARVQRILHGQGWVQNHFQVENWPEGLVPSTTATFDYAILALYLPLSFFLKNPLDWAGALISPVLWMALVLFWAVLRSREFNRLARMFLISGSAVLQPIIWATAFGRPRHQSLILVLMALGLSAEYERWQIGMSPRRAWNIFAGSIWGLACWTSLYEPLAVFGVVVLFNFAIRRKENVEFSISFGVVMLLALLVEGFHIFIPPAEYRPALARWLEFITEMRGLTFGQLSQAMTLIFFLLPPIAYRLVTKNGGQKTDYLVVVLVAILTFCSFFQRRWIEYACLAEIFLLARYLQLEPIRWVRAVVVAVFVMSAIYVNDTEIKGIRAAPPNQPSPEIALLARSIDQPGGILAPWWISPGLLYFSRQPIVSGSSHCGISGIVASARFYSATSWVEAEKILQQRQVHWIVVWDDPRYVYPLLASSQEILGLPVSTEQDKGNADDTVSHTLIVDRYVPTSLHLRAITQEFKLYEYLPMGVTFSRIRPSTDRSL